MGAARVVDEVEKVMVVVSAPTMVQTDEEPYYARLPSNRRAPRI